MYERVSPSGSDEPAASSETDIPSSTVWSGPASAVGGSLVGWTVISTVSASVPPLPSLTSTSNVSVVAVSTSGAANDGVAAFPSWSETDGPPVWVHEYEMVSPSGSDEPVASKLTDVSSSTVWSGPASAVGGSFVGWTVISTVSVSTPPLPSLASTSKVSVVAVSTFGAVNEGVTVLAFWSETDGPAVCAQVYERVSPSGSLEPVASMDTDSSSSTVWSGPASAVGGSFVGWTVISTVSVSVPLFPSLISTWKVSVV